MQKGFFFNARNAPYSLCRKASSLTQEKQKDFFFNAGNAPYPFL